MADGHIKISSKIDNSQAEKDFKELENLIKEYAGKNEKSLTAALKKSQNEYDRLNKKINSSTIEMELLGKSIDDLEKKKLNEELLGRDTGAKMVQDQIDAVFDKMDALADETAVWELGLIQVDASLEQIGNRLEKAAHSQISANEAAKQSAYQSELQAQGIAVATDDIVIGTRKWADVIDNKVNYGYTDTENKVRVLTSVQKDNVVETEKLVGATNKVAIATGRAVKESKNLGKSTSLGVGKIGRYALALFSIRSIYGMLSKLSNQWLNSNDIAAQRTKAQIEQMSSMVSNLLAPAIQFLVNLAAQLLGYLNAVMKAFFGVDLASKKTNKNTGGIAKGAKKANKEIQRMKAGFDEFETLTKDAGDNLDDIGGGAGGGIDDFVVPTPDTSLLEKVFDKLKADMKPFIDTMKNLNWQPLIDSTKRLGSVMSDTFGIIYDSAIRTLNNAVAPFIEIMVEEIAPRAINAVADAFEMLNPHIDYFMQNFIEPFTEWLLTEFVPATLNLLIAAFEFLIPVVDNVLEGLKEWYEFIKPVFEWLGEIALGAIEGITESIEEFTEKVKNNEDGMADLFKILGFAIGAFITMKGVILVGTPIIKLFGSAVKIVTGFVKGLWAIGKVIATFFAGAFSGSVVAITALVATLGLMILGLITNFEQVKKDFMTIVGNIKGIISGLLNFIAGVFTGNWKRAFKGLADAVTNAFSGIANTVKFPINLIVDGVNAMIGGLNKIKVPSWVPGVGGKGINLPRVPRLQRGTIINRPQFIAGDGGAEAVIPLENDTRALEMIAQMLADFMDTGDGGNIIIQLGNEVVFKALIRELKKQQMQSNGGVALGF